MSTDRKLHVFLCYSSEDKFIARDFYQRLCAEGWIDPWLDEERIVPGMNRQVEIERAIESADVVLVFLSHNSVDKEGYIQHELKIILDVALDKPEGTIFIIPLKLDECQVPRKMRSLQPIDFSLVENRKQAYDLLLKSLKIKDDVVNERVGRTSSAHFASPQHAQTEPDVTPLVFDGFDFVKIPKGRFIIGSKASNTLASKEEIPQYPCTIPYDYWISRYPISNEQFSEFAVSTECTAVLPIDWREKLKYPIVNVSWRNAVSYTGWLNKVLGREIPRDLIFRLPTEAEWERASR